MFVCILQFHAFDDLIHGLWSIKYDQLVPSKVHSKFSTPPLKLALYNKIDNTGNNGINLSQSDKYNFPTEAVRRDPRFSPTLRG